MRHLARYVVVLCLIVTGGSVAWTGAEQSPAPRTLSADERQSFATAWARQPRVDVGVPADGARVVILKFNDYECPACRQAEAAYALVLEKFAASHPKAVKYVVKDWPWNAACNFNATRTIPGHEAACDAAAAARMARDRGKFAEMAAWLYANQGVTPEAVRAAASRMLGLADFESEYRLKLTDIRRDIAEGGVLRIDSTPTYFINGVRLPSGILPPELFELAITLELSPAP